MSLGPLRLGASRAEVHQTIGQPSREFRKGAAPNAVEAYDSVGVHAYYDADETVEFLEAFSPCEAVYREVDLLAADTQLVIDRLREIGLEPRDDGGGGLWFDDHGFALYAPAGVTEGVSVFRRGYDTGA